ncbi:MAG: ComEC/Rec2 family competence protein [Candidatus Bathyarchaeia archaeon]
MLFIISVIVFSTLVLFNVNGVIFVDGKDTCNLLNPIYVSSVPSIGAPSVLENVNAYFWDVGQGDSILIHAGERNVLIDGGSESAGSALLRYLWSVNVSHLDYLVVTHPHADHVGGLPALLTSNITVDVILYNGQNYSSQIFQQFMNLAQEHNLTVACRGQFYPLTSMVNFTVFNPAQPFELPADDLNVNSVVIKLQTGNASFLFTGDATAETEQRMIAAGLNLESDVLKVGHHGSKYATSQAFLDAVNPSYAVISVGAGNVYGHPHSETLQRLVSKGVAIYRTDDLGTIVFATDGTAVSVIPETYSMMILAVLALILLILSVILKSQKV